MSELTGADLAYSLEQYLASMPEDAIFTLYVDEQARRGFDPDLDGYPRYVQFCAYEGGMVRCEVVSNTYLPADMQHTIDDLITMRSDGWTLPDDEHVSGSPNLYVDTDVDDLRHMLEINVLGTALGIKHAFRTMRPGGAAGSGGAVINVASVAATIAFPGISVYSATKSGVDRLTRVAAMESGKLGYGVRVNCIYPGLVPTAMGAGLANDVAALGLFGSPEEAVGAVIELTPSGRLGEVGDIADAVVFLASDAARFVNGAGLPVDGGMGM